MKANQIQGVDWRFHSIGIAGCWNVLDLRSKVHWKMKLIKANQTQRNQMFTHTRWFDHSTWLGNRGENLRLHRCWVGRSWIANGLKKWEMFEIVLKTHQKAFMFNKKDCKLQLNKMGSGPLRWMQNFPGTSQSLKIQPWIRWRIQFTMPMWKQTQNIQVGELSSVRSRLTIQVKSYPWPWMETLLNQISM